MKIKKSEFKKVLTESILETLNDEAYTPGSPEQAEFVHGQNRGVLARTKGGKYIMDYKTQKNHYPKAFWKGYFSVTGEGGLSGAYNKANDWFTGFLGRFGYGNSRR